MTIKADKPLLLPLYKHFINPMELKVVGAKNLPLTGSEKYEQVYV